MLVRSLVLAAEGQGGKTVQRELFRDYELDVLNINLGYNWTRVWP